MRLDNPAIALASLSHNMSLASFSYEPYLFPCNHVFTLSADSASEMEVSDIIANETTAKINGDNRLTVRIIVFCV